jgi:hypothetical protein
VVVLDKHNQKNQRDFSIIKKSSHWAAFEAGWNAANSNRDVYEQAYTMGVMMGKEIAKHEYRKQETDSSDGEHSQGVRD